MPVASLDKVKGQASNPPPSHLDKLPKKSAKKAGGKKATTLKKAGGSKDAATPPGKVEALPSSMAQMYPDADLSGVKVTYNSTEAADKGVDGFAKEEEIHIAPGADKEKTLRHEVAHVVQYKNTGKEEGAAASRGDAEEKAEKAESEKVSADDLGSADPSKVHNKDTNANDSGLPKIEFNGKTFDKVSGEFNKELVKTDWDPIKLFSIGTFWPFPALPCAGISIKLSSSITPSAALTAKAQYEYQKEGNKFAIKGVLEGALKAELDFSLMGGVALSAWVQEGGVGIEASAILDVHATAARSLEFAISEKGLEWTVVPIEFDIGAALKAALSLVCWTEGWFYNDKWKWTFAEWTLASLTGYKGVVEIGAGGGEGLNASFKDVKPGTFAWGSPPAPTESNGSKV